MNRSIPILTGVLLTTSLVGISPQPGQSQSTGVSSPVHASECVEMEVPSGTFFMVEAAEGSKGLSLEDATRIEGDATIMLGKNLPAIHDASREALQLWKEAHWSDAVRLRIRHSRITIARGQPNYSSHVFIEPLPAQAISK